VDVFNKRNALIGFLTLEVLKRRRRAKQLRRRAPKIAVVSLLGLASLAALAGIIAVVLRRRNGEDVPAIVQDDEEIVGEYVTASAEPIPAA
jgi:hypothetical protein